MCSITEPATTSPPPMPSSRAMAAAVMGWSPVIMTGRIPAAAGLDGAPRFRAWRVKYADQPDEGQALFDRDRLRCTTVGDGEHPHGVAAPWWRWRP